jgi:CHAT domain-containing protein
VLARAGARRGDGRVRLDRERLRASLAGGTLLAYFVEDGALHAIAVRGGRATLHRLGGADEAAGETASLLFALRRLVRRTTSAASAEAALAGLEQSASRLAELVLPPLDDGARLVIVPTGALHHLPWGALPPLAGRPLTVAPSVGAWLRALHGTPSRDDRRVALIAGPDLPAAAAEVSALAEAYPGAIALGPSEATVEAALAALDGASVAHLAAHGELRADNPLFSSLRLADGPLTVHDLDGLAAAPAVVVLGACESAASVVGAGDELLGLAAALLRLGSCSLVAPLVPVPDEETRPLLELLHAELARGRACADALAAVRVAAAGGHPRTLAAAAAFVALGA